MLRALLFDRFHLEAQIETRQLPIYALVVAKGGARLPENTDKQFSVTNLSNGKVRATGQVKWGFSKTTMGVFAAQLSGVVASSELGRQVIDKTGLTGEYDFVLKWLLSTNEMRPTSGSDGGTGGPSIFNALQDQLGLKLQPDRGPVEVIVIDRVEKPSGN